MDDSSSSSSSQQRQCTYDVFLSFRGEDTRKGFTDHLYKALEQTGIHTFRDDDEIPRGTQIQQQLEKAIQESRISVVVFSKDYASSRWCLDELVKITRRAETDGHIIIPVFYHVDPSDVRKQTGSFAEAFAKHERRFKEEMDMVEGWRRALSEVPDLAGMVLGDRYESKFIRNLVEVIGNKLERKAPFVTSYAVGIDRRVQDINMWLEDGSGDVGIAVICGMGGIGKTTIAKTAFNQNVYRFQGSSFLADVREVSEQPKGRLDLQRQLLSDIQKRKTEKLYNLDDGIEKIKRVVCCKRVLIVFDDVDNLDQLLAVLGDRKWSYPKSKIIITTRNERLLKGHEVMYDMFTVNALYECESLELFSWYAFKQADPIEGFMELSTTLVQRCEGLPLALQVLGSSLSEQSVEIWRDALQNLDVSTEGKIGKVLRRSFDSLQVRDQSLFLNLACFFIREDKYFIITVLDNCGFSTTRIGLQNLIHRCLVRFNESNQLVMHGLLRDMGMEIIQEECPEDSGNRSRVLHMDAINVLRKLSGTEKIKGLMLMEDESSKTTFRSIKKRRNIEDYEGSSSRRRRVGGIFSWQPINFFSKSSASVSDEIGFKTEAFTRMNNLEILVLSNVKFRGCYKHFPQNLIWLCWSGFPEESLPENFSLSSVVALDLENSSLRHVWKKTPDLSSLKFLNLSHSHHLITTPDFSRLPNLERLSLEDCPNLVEVDESIGELDKLVFLNMKDCKNLMKLPRSQSLQTLIVSGCSKLFHHQSQATATCREKVSQILTNSWRSICPWVLSRKKIELNSLSFANFSNHLSSLCLANCNLSAIPNGICFLPSLTHLDVRENPMISLPENMNRLIMLETLEIDSCTKLRTLPRLPPSLNGLYADSCRSLKRIANLPNVSTTLNLTLWDCGFIDEVEGLFMIKPLRSIGEKMKQRLPRYLGLFDFESQGSISDQLVQMYHFLTCTCSKLPPQVLYECGIFSTFFHGSKIPEFFDYKRVFPWGFRSVVEFTLPLNSHNDDPNCKIRGLNACVVYDRDSKAGLRLSFRTIHPSQ